MNIEKERELFGVWARGNGFSLMLDWDDINQRYNHDVTHFAFSSWLASRNREGYVLVPKHELKIILSCVSPDDMNLYEGVYEASEVIEKAMIGACDD